MVTDIVYEEKTAQRNLERVPLAHLSIEMGHLYAEDFGPGNVDLKRYFDRIAPWVEVARAECRRWLPRGVKPRVSACFLVDDYFNRFGEPAEVVTALCAIAEQYGLTIDYIAREAACAVAADIPLAQIVLDRVVIDPAQRTTGSHPPANESGWLSNGQRSPADPVIAAMKAQPKWAPPLENGPNLHSIFMDVELFREIDGARKWSCAFLASVWQLLRLGLLRHMGAGVARPVALPPDAIPSAWDKMPPVLQVNPTAAPFSAYRTMSILQGTFLNVEAAVKTILNQVSIDSAVLTQVAKRSIDEGIELPEELTGRIGYVLLND